MNALDAVAAEPAGRPSGVWHAAAFRNLFAAHTISTAGAQISLIAIPLIAADRLGAGPVEMGLLGAAGALPALLVGLGAGVIADRRRRKPLLIAADIGRALLLLTIPLVALFDALEMAQLYVVAFLSGALTIIFASADRSFLPSIVPREQLLDGNSALELGTSSMDVAGPAAAGGAMYLLGAAGAVAFDALSYVLSALFLTRIQVEESPVQERHASIHREVAEGLRAVFNHPVLRAITLCTATLALFNGAFDALFLFLMVREFNLNAGWIGVVFAIGSLGFVVGALVAPRLVRRIGPVEALAIGVIAAGISDALVLLVDGPIRTVVPALIGVQFIFGLGAMVYRVGAVTLRQSLAPDHLLGRVNAAVEVVAWGVAPVGALLGGLCAAAFGLRETLLVAAIGEVLAALWLLGRHTPIETDPDAACPLQLS
jgi:MFS family permease